MISYILASLLFLIICISSRKRKKKPQGTVVRNLPGPPGLPVIGTFTGLSIERFFFNLYNWANKYGKIFSFVSLGNRYVILSDARLIRKLFTNEAYRDLVRERPRSIVNDNLMPNDLIFSNRMHEQQQMRTIFKKALDIYGDGVQKFESVVCDELLSLSARISLEDGRDFDICPFIHDSLSNLISILVSRFRLLSLIIVITHNSVVAEALGFRSLINRWRGKIQFYEIGILVATCQASGVRTCVMENSIFIFILFLFPLLFFKFIFIYPSNTRL